MDKLELDEHVRQASDTELPPEDEVEGSYPHQIVDKSIYVETQDGGQRRIDFVRTVYIPPSIILGEE